MYIEGTMIVKCQSYGSKMLGIRRGEVYSEDRR